MSLLLLGSVFRHGRRLTQNDQIGRPELNQVTIYWRRVELITRAAESNSESNSNSMESVVLPGIELGIGIVKKLRLESNSESNLIKNLSIPTHIDSD